MDVSGSPQALRQARLMVMSGAVSLITLQASPASSPGSCRACAAEGDSHPRASTPLGPTLASRSYCHLVHNQSLGPPGFKGWGNPLSIGEQTCRSTSQGGMSHGPPCALSIGALPQGAAGLWWPFVPPPCAGTADALRVSLGGVFHCDANAQGSHLPPTFPLMVGILCPCVSASGSLLCHPRILGVKCGNLASGVPWLLSGLATASP